MWLDELSRSHKWYLESNLVCDINIYLQIWQWYIANDIACLSFARIPSNSITIQCCRSLHTNNNIRVHCVSWLQFKPIFERELYSELNIYILVIYLWSFAAISYLYFYSNGWDQTLKASNFYITIWLNKCLDLHLN